MNGGVGDCFVGGMKNKVFVYGLEGMDGWMDGW